MANTMAKQTAWIQTQPPFTRGPGVSSRPAVLAVARAQGREKAGL